MTQGDESYWFKPRRYGYGARPSNWKGWVSCFSWFARTKTDGEWRWRWGERE